MQQDIERLSKIGLSVHPTTLHRKLVNWQNILDSDILSARDSWANGGHSTYQIIGDNWDKDILPSYRTSDRKTLSLHLFNMYAILDRVVFPPENYEGQTDNIEPAKFIPSVSEQEQLMQELCFVISTSIIENHPRMNELLKRVYLKHLEHTYSRYAGEKTTQVMISS